MKGLVYAMLAAAVMSLGFWAYKENYLTQAALREVRRLEAAIDARQARLDRLEAEWAYLNRPDRLRDLVALNFERLGLVPMSPGSFGEVGDVAMPPAIALGPILNSVVVSSDGALGAPGWEEPL